MVVLGTLKKDRKVIDHRFRGIVRISNFEGDQKTRIHVSLLVSRPSCFLANCSFKIFPPLPSMEVKVDLTPMEKAILRENCESIKDLVLETMSPDCLVDGVDGCTYPSEKYESQLRWYHQPAVILHLRNSKKKRLVVICNTSLSDRCLLLTTPYFQNPPGF